MLRYAVLLCAAFLLSHVSWPSPALAQVQPVSQCQAIAQSLPDVIFASFSLSSSPVQAQAEEVTITYIGHSTF